LPELATVDAPETRPAFQHERATRRRASARGIAQEEAAT
jgi:hypothetical protein